MLSCNHVSQLMSILKMLLKHDEPPCVRATAHLAVISNNNFCFKEILWGKNSLS